MQQWFKKVSHTDYGCKYNIVGCPKYRHLTDLIELDHDALGHQVPERNQAIIHYARSLTKNHAMSLLQGPQLAKGIYDGSGDGNLIL